MADIASRLRLVEKKLDFLMANARAKAAISSGLSGPDGSPLPPRVFEASLAELWALSRAIPTQAAPAEVAQQLSTPDEGTSAVDENGN